MSPLQRAPYLTALPIVSLMLLACIPPVGADTETKIYSDPARENYPNQVYWGDTHLHTSLSVDSSGRGNERITPDTAYRFAAGQTVRTHTGEEMRLKRPLDFLVVADHAENLGVIPRVIARDPEVLATPVGKKWREIWDEAGWSATDKLATESLAEWKKALKMLSIPSGEPQAFFWQAWNDDYLSDEGVRRSIWSEVCENADYYNKPGEFTAFIGFEWTPAYADDAAPNLHRNVVFKGGKDTACQVLPFSIQDSRDVEDLWAYLKSYEETTGDEAIAIPHNGNMTRGNLFAPVNFFDQPLDMDYLLARRRWEPIMEVTQIKGDSETHPLLSPTDEFADFETYNPAREKSPDVLRYEYARSGLKLGLDYLATTGINPFKFGMIGSSDSHTGMSAIAEDNFTGKFTLIEPTRHRAIESWWFSASGLAAVWAEENTRSSIFAAMKRKEAYATTGTRISVRFFGGWEFKDDDAFSHRMADIGYRNGVPMGGDLTSAPKGKSPRFLVRAVKDPDRANLDRIQVVKGWRDADGTLNERVYDVALSDKRRPNRKGEVKPLKSTVDVNNASYTNTTGAPELAVVWEDPDFDATVPAFYYLRVLEIQTPRWVTYDAAYYGNMDSIPEQAPKVIQERAYTSPIWYTP